MTLGTVLTAPASGASPVGEGGMQDWWPPRSPRDAAPQSRALAHKMVWPKPLILRGTGICCCVDKTRIHCELWGKKEKWSDRRRWGCGDQGERGDEGYSEITREGPEAREQGQDLARPLPPLVSPPGRVGCADPSCLA